MSKSQDFKVEFDRLATDGYIGNLTGKSAYAYVRVSGDEQAEEGRSGLPRQIAHVHEAAVKHGYKIAWDMVFADDYTGFEFEDRPQLTLLRRELKTPNRRADAVVMEHLDRLSRHADWHQGFLLDEMQKAEVTPIFWKEFSSRIERTVMGAIAQEGMEQAKQRMAEGKRHKARTGRVTANVPAYGYRFVDGNGNEGEAAKRETHYAHKEDEATVIRYIYQRVASGDTMRGIAADLDKAGVKPPKNYTHWEGTQVRLLIKSEVYKGDYYAHRWEHTKVEKPTKDGLSNRVVQAKVERPREEWIHVPVPPIVTPELWEAANRILKQNAKMSQRNAKEPYLLTGLVRCAHCGWSYVGTTSRKNRHGNERSNPYRAYRCPQSGVRPKHLSDCNNRYIQCETLDNAVWSIVYQALLEPKVLLSAFNDDAIHERRAELERQIDYLERELASRSDHEEKLMRAYMADIIDVDELAGRKRQLKAEITKINDELAQLCAQALSNDELAHQKQSVIQMAAALRESDLPFDAPFSLKQRVIKLVVNKITLDAAEGWLRLEGAVQGTFPIGNTRMDMDSLRQPS